MLFSKLPSLFSNRLVSLTLISGAVYVMFSLLSFLWQKNTALIAINQQLMGELNQQKQHVTYLNNEKRLLQQQLLASHKKITDTTLQLQQRAKQLTQLKDDHEQIKTWADTTLPAAIKRMHERPAITGTQQFQDWLSTSEFMSTTGKSAKTQSGSQ